MTEGWKKFPKGSQYSAWDSYTEAIKIFLRGYIAYIINGMASCHNSTAPPNSLPFKHRTYTTALPCANLWRVNFVVSTSIYCPIN